MGESTESRKGEKEARWITHYSSSHKILLVGEGDFSFSACLARFFGSAQNMVATSLDSEVLLHCKYGTSVANLKELKSLGCTILLEVDVKDMDEHDTLKTMKFDRIVYNFPHSGYHLSYRETHPKLIRRHKKLMKAFFASASKMLTECGEIHVSHRDDHPYVKWELEKLAEGVHLVLIEKAEFKKWDYPGYENKKGDGRWSNNTFPLKESFTFKFSPSLGISKLMREFDDNLLLDQSSSKIDYV